MVREKSFRLEVFLISLAAILLEISMTRIFSFKLYYYFTYLILGIAMLGLGAGGVFVAIFPRLRERDPVRLVSECCFAGGVLVPIAYAAIAWIQISVVELTTSPSELFKLFVICTSLFSPFLLVGIVLATVFGTRPRDINRLYFADLVGAGLGCAICVPLFILITPPGSVFASGLILALAGAICARGASPAVQGGSLAAAAAMLVAILVPGAIPDPVPDPIKTMSPQRVGRQEVLFSGWSSVFRVDVLQPSENAPFLTLHHDGNIGSALHRFDGDFSSVARYDDDKRSQPFSVLDPGPKVLIIGLAGGQELLASLYLGASRVTGVELNPLTVSLLSDRFSDFTGRIASDSRSVVVNAEGRSYLDKTDEMYDLIWLVAPDSYAAMNAASSGAFVLSESYLYTVEMIQQSLSHLNDGGVICAQFGELYLNSRPNRTPRYIATAREAFRRLGVDDFRKHVIVSAGPGILPASTTLLSRTPFTPEQTRRYLDKAERLDKTRMWFPTRPGDEFSNSVSQIITLPAEELARFFDDYYFDVTPITDDAPFFWHFTPFRKAVFGKMGQSAGIPDFEVATGERMLALLLLFATLFAAVFILLPTLAIRDVWSQIPHKASAGLYFAALGLGFMFIEVCLIQKLALFLGYPSFSLTVTLFSLLLSSGVGSLLSGRYSGRRNRALGFLMGGLTLVILAIQFGFPIISDVFETASLAVRIAVAVLCMAPVGLCLGAFMPIGIGTVSSLTAHSQQYVAWAWAVNGFFSVVASVLATMLSMTFGFTWVFWLALVIYAVGVTALSRTPEPAAIG